MRARNSVLSRKTPLSADNKFCRIARVFVQAGRPSAMKVLSESPAKSVVAAAVSGGRFLVLPLATAAATTSEKKPRSSRTERSRIRSPTATPTRAFPSRGLKTPKGKFSIGKSESGKRLIKDLSGIFCSGALRAPKLLAFGGHRPPLQQIQAATGRGRNPNARKSLHGEHRS